MLTDCQQELGEHRTYCLAKELTKMFETIRIGSCAELLVWCQEKPEHLKGEFVVLIGPDQKKQDTDWLKAEELLKTLLEYLPLKTAVRVVAEHYEVNKNQLYDVGLGIRKQ